MAKKILVTGGAGAVGRYAIQMARLGGARVIATVSSSAKAAHAGAEEWINYRDTDVAEAVMEMTGGEGVDRIVEVDFGANQAASLECIGRCKWMVTRDFPLSFGGELRFRVTTDRRNEGT